MTADTDELKQTNSQDFLEPNNQENLNTGINKLIKVSNVPKQKDIYEQRIYEFPNCGCCIINVMYHATLHL
jgi:hypothetical protein